MPYGFNDDKSKFDLDELIHKDDTGWIATANGGEYRKINNIVEYRYNGTVSGSGSADVRFDTIPDGARPVEYVRSYGIGYDGNGDWHRYGVTVNPSNGYVLASIGSTTSYTTALSVVWFAD